MGLVFIIILFIIIFIIPNFLFRKKDKKWFKKSFKLEANLTDVELKSTLLKSAIFMASLALIGFFIGTGLGGGYKINKKLKSNEIEYNDRISFINGDVFNVEVLGKNSTYIFYLTKENKIVKVTPINGIVKHIEEVK